jgi:regulator of nonsense transcripts 1
MSAALGQFAGYEASISGHLFHRLLGHEVPPLLLRLPAPPGGGCGAPGLPPLNHSQLAAVRSVLASPLSLIQGPPGTGKTVTSATIVYHICKAAGSQVKANPPGSEGGRGVWVAEEV